MLLGTPLWSPNNDESEDFPTPPAPTAPNVSTAPARGTPLWSPGDDESEDYPPPPAPTAPNVSTQPARETSARGIPVGSLLSRALRREHYAPEILRVVEPALDPVRSDTTADRNDFDAADVMTTKPGVAATALIEAPTDTTPAPQAPDRPPQMNWAENEAFQFHPEAHCLSTVPSASPHPEGMQYGPARRSSRACAKMLVRAGHRCPACFCLTSLCRCHRERLTICLCPRPGGYTARSRQGHAHASLCVSQAAELFFNFRLEPLIISSTQMSVRNPDPIPHGWQHPHPCQWQVLYRSYSRRQRRLSRQARESRPLPSAVAQSVFHSICNWLHTRSPLATMNPHRPGGGPRQHYRPDGSRRRTAGELAKRAAARAAAAAADAAGGGAAKPAGPVAAKDGTSAGALVPAQVPVSTAPTGEPSASTSASTSASASSSAAAPVSAPTSGLAHGAYPSRVQHPPPSIAAGPKLSGNGQRTWMPALPALKVKAPPPNLHQTGLTETESKASTQPPRRGRQKQVRWQPTKLTDRRSRSQSKHCFPRPPLGSRLALMRRSCHLSRRLLGGRRGAEHNPLDRCQLQNMQRRNGLR